MNELDTVKLKCVKLMPSNEVNARLSDVIFLMTVTFRQISEGSFDRSKNEAHNFAGRLKTAVVEQLFIQMEITGFHDFSCFEFISPNYRYVNDNVKQRKSSSN